MVAAFDYTGTVKSFGGNDYVYSSGASVVIGSGNGNDMVQYFTDIFDVTLNRYEYFGDAKIRSGKGHDIVVAHGEEIIVYGGSGNDQIEVGGDNVKVRGGSGNDGISFWPSIAFEASKSRLFGDEGNDLIFGHAGNDVIDGGSGSDYLGVGLILVFPH